MPILVTPFDERGGIDEESLARLIDFNIAAGVHGLGVALGSEIFKFNEAERDAVTRAVVRAGRGPGAGGDQHRRRRHRPRGLLQPGRRGRRAPTR